MRKLSSWTVAAGIALFGGTAAQAQLTDQPTTPRCAADLPTEASAVYRTGLFTTIARPGDRWHVSYEPSHDSLRVMWFTHRQGRPVWFVTTPIKRQVGSLMTLPLHERATAKGHEAYGVERSAGTLTLRWDHAARLALSWKMTSGDAGEACVSALWPTPAPKGEPELGGIWNNYLQDLQRLTLDSGIVVARVPADGTRHARYKFIAALFDQTDAPVWLEAEADVTDQARPSGVLDLAYLSTEGRAVETVGTLELAALQSENRVPFQIRVPANGARVLQVAATGQQLLWATPHTSVYERSEQTASLTATLDTTTCESTSHPGQTTFTPLHASLRLRTKWSKTACRITLSWSKPEPHRVWFSALAARDVDLEASDGPPGSRVLDLPATQFDGSGTFASYFFHVGAAAVGPQIQFMSIEVSEMADTQAPPAGAHRWSAAELTALMFNSDSNWSATPRCHWSRGVPNYDNAIPMRWSVSGKPYYFDIEQQSIPGTNPNGKYRVSAHLLDAAGRPVWLQSDWMAGSSTREYRGFLRRYTWNDLSKTRSSGEVVGVMLMQPRIDTSNAATPIEPGLRVRWQLQGTGLQTVLDEWVCLQPTFEELTFGEQAPRAANAAYAGVWASSLAENLSAVDAMMTARVGPSATAEHHIIRAWTATGQPFWMYAGETRLSLELPDEDIVPAINANGPLGLRARIGTSATTGVCDVPLKRSGNRIHWRRRFNTSANPAEWYYGTFELDLMNVVAPRESYCAYNVQPLTVNWKFPLPSNSGTNEVRTINLDNLRFESGQLSMSRIAVTPYNCLINEPGEACAVDISWVSNRSDLRIRTPDGVIPQSGVLPPSGILRDWRTEVGRHTYELLLPNSQWAANPGSMFVRSRLIPPPGVGCAKIEGVSTPAASCETAPSLASATKGTPLQMRVSMPTSVATLKVRVSPEVPQCFRGFRLNGPPMVLTRALELCNTPGRYEFQLQTCWDGEVACSEVTRVSILITGSLSAPTGVAAVDRRDGRFELAWDPYNSPTHPDIYHRWGYRRGAVSGPAPTTIGSDMLQTAYSGRMSGSDTYRFYVNACMRVPLEPPLPDGTDSQEECSDWSAPSNAVVLTAQPDNFTVSPLGGYRTRLNWTYSWGTPVGFFRYGYTDQASTVPTQSTETTTIPVNVEVPSSATPMQWYFGVQACSDPGHCSSWKMHEPGLLLPQEGGLPLSEEPAAFNPPSTAELIANSRVGASDGEMRVNEGGQLTYSMPILTAPGRGNVVPQLSLSYSGGAEMGAAGIGWHISGLSAITRCRKSVESGDGPGPHPPINFDNDSGNDAYCLDGQRLIQVGTDSNGSYREYRTEIESMQRVRGYLLPGQMHDIAYWQVEGKDGMTREYGRDYPEFTTQSAVWANESQMDKPWANWGPNDDPNPILVQKPEPQPLIRMDCGNPPCTTGKVWVMSWSISRAIDRMGNGIYFRYDRGDLHEYQHLAAVFYTSHSSVGSSLPPHAAIQFRHQELQEPARGRTFIAGHETLSRWVLRDVRSCLRVSNVQWPNAGELQDACGTAIAGVTMLRTYEPVYERLLGEQPPGSATSGARRSLMPRITEWWECTYPGGQRVCWEPTRFGWYGGDVKFTGAQECSGNQCSHDIFKGLASYKAADVDGDGVQELVYREQIVQSGDAGMDRLYTVRSTPCTGVPADGCMHGIQFMRSQDQGAVKAYVEIARASDNYADGRDPERTWNIVDVNGDGQDDLVSAHLAPNGFWRWGVYYYKSDLAAFAGQPDGYLTSAGSGNDLVGDLNNMQTIFSDISGDGLVDLLYVHSSFSGSGSQKTLNWRKGFRDGSGMLSFGAANQVLLEFLLDEGEASGGVYQIGFGRSRPDRWNSLDVNGDAFADLIVRYRRTLSSGAGEYSYTGEYENNHAPEESNPRGTTQLERTAIFVSDGTGNFRQVTRSFHGESISDGDDALRAVDLNGDGLVDLVYQLRNGQWFYQLNLGQERFATARCLIPVNQFGGCAATHPGVQSQQVSHARQTVVIQDYDGDGRADVWVGQRCSNGTECGMANSGAQWFAVYLWTDIPVCGSSFASLDPPVLCSHFSGHVVTSHLRSNYGEGRTHLLFDWNGDGHLESIVANVVSGARYGLQVLSADLDTPSGPRFPRDLVRTITSGFGAATEVQHAALAGGAVYTAEIGSPRIRNWGRGSLVVDVNGPMYVVSRLETPAPVAGMPQQTAGIRYRYQGLRTQTGGRGSLGFSNVYTLNEQSGVETQTTYAQRFPLTGRPLRTRSRLVPPSSYAEWITTKVTKCAEPHCGHFLPDAVTASWAVISIDIEEPHYRYRTGGSGPWGAQDAVLPSSDGGPAIVFPYTTLAEKRSFDPYAPVGSLPLSVVRTHFVGPSGEFAWDEWGNLLYSAEETGVIPSDDKFSLLKSVQSAHTYHYPDLDRWVHGLLLSSVVEHSRAPYFEGTGPGQLTVQRNSRFEYTTNGQLWKEHLQEGNAALQQTKVRVYNAYGLEVSSTTCSRSVVNAGHCTGSFVPTAVPAVPTRANQHDVYRYSETVYADAVQLPNGTPLNIPGLPLPAGGRAPRLIGGQIELADTGTITYNHYGQPLLAKPTGQPETRSVYDAFGRAVYQYSATGASSTTDVRFCNGTLGAGATGGGVACPAHAVLRARTLPTGGTASYTYTDVLARTVLTQTPLLQRGQFAWVWTEYDLLGRQVAQSEPVSGAEHTFPGAMHQSRSCYDVLGRVVRLKQPNHVYPDPVNSPSRLCIDPHTVGAGANLIDTVYSGLDKTTVNGKGQVMSERRNPLGELVESTDSDGNLTQFSYDALGQLVQVLRFAGNHIDSQIEMSYDDMGRQTAIRDPDAGYRQMFYNPAGELVRTLDAKNQCIEHVLDFAGRIVRTIEHQGQGCPATGVNVPAHRGLTTFEYDASALGRLDRTDYVDETNYRVQITPYYDTLGRAYASTRCVTMLTLAGELCHPQKTGFDRYGRVMWQTDASSEGLVANSPYPELGEVYRGVRSVYATGTENTAEGMPLSAGFMYKLQDLGSNRVWQEVLASTPRGQVARERRLGNNAYAISRSYEDSTGRLMGITSGSGPGNWLQDLDYQYDVLGNLTVRHDQSNGRNVRETGDYDVLNRVVTTQLSINGTLLGTQVMSYSPTGNITSKNGGSTGAYAAATVTGYQYGAQHSSCGNSSAAGVHAVTYALTPLGQRYYCYDANGNQTHALEPGKNGTVNTHRSITYTPFDKPAIIQSREGVSSGHTTFYRYGPAREIASRVDAAEWSTLIGNGTLEVQYLNGVELEIRKSTPTSTSASLRVQRHVAGMAIETLSRTATQVNGEWVQTADPQQPPLMDLVFGDNLGSTHLLLRVNASGAEVERHYQAFDVWGFRRDVVNNTGNTLGLINLYTQFSPLDPNKTRTRKGYTGHEMVDGAGIVHMGGRIYDPMLGRFLQADPLIQDPLNSQSHNRYTYVFNNPLSLTDPSGYRSLSANIERYWRPALAVAAVIVTGNIAAAHSTMASVATTMGNVASSVGANTLASSFATIAAGHTTTAGLWAMGGGFLAGGISSGSLRGAVMGAVEAGLSFGIGRAIDAHDLGGFAGNMGMHALKGGVLAEFSSGDFGHGFRGAAFNKVAGVAIAGAKPGGFGTQLTLAALAGGLISQATGGKFGNGAVSAAIQFAYNEKQHNLRRSRNYDVGYRFVKRLREDLYGKRFESELDAWRAFAGPAGRMTETTGMEFGANLIQARDGFYIVDITQGLETGVGIPNYRGIQRWVAFMHTHPSDSGEGFSGSAQFNRSVIGGLRTSDGDIRFAVQSGIDAYVRKPSGDFNNTYQDWRFRFDVFRSMIDRAGPRETITDLDATEKLK